MPPTTKKFAWKDRDTAGYDLLQLVYHAPPFISYHALRLLEVIRSPKIVPELFAMVLDESLLSSYRVHALRAAARSSTNILAAELKDVATLSLHPNSKLRKSRFFREVLLFVAKHPVNDEWFLDIVENLDDPRVQKAILKHLISAAHSSHSHELQRLAIAQLLTLLDKHPHLLALDTVSCLTINLQYSQIWLDAHLNEIIAMCMTNIGGYTFQMVIRQWTALADILREQVSNFDEILINSAIRVSKPESETQRPEFLQSPAYQYLYQKYLDGLGGNTQALNHLTQASRINIKNIPFRAVAVHFIGQLYQQFDVGEILYQQIGDVRDDWGESYISSPVRYEAGEALLKLLSAETWERLVNAFLITPREALSLNQIRWIEYITDILSGDIPEVLESKFELHHRAWFKALAHMSEKELGELTKNIR
jgi:hypothetical protein